MVIFFYRAALPALFFLLFLTACSQPACRQWEIQITELRNPCFNSGKMFLAPESNTCYLELELTRAASGLRLYLNILFLQAPPWAEDSSRSLVTILFPDQEPLMTYPYILKGGQRLLFPTETTDYLINKLLAGESFTIQMGRQKTEIIATYFSVAYQELMNIPLACDQ